MIGAADVTGLILCGGAGTRLGGRDKPLELLGGVPLVEHVRERLQPQVARVLISCNRNFDAYGRWNDTIVRDEAANRGPLGGVLAGMDSTQTEYLFVCPGDAPFLSTTLVDNLASALDRNPADIAIPRDGVRRQHLFPLMRRSLAGPLRHYLDTGGRSVHAFVETQRTVVIDAADREAFFNVNSEADLRAAAAMLPGWTYRSC